MKVLGEVDEKNGIDQSRAAWREGKEDDAADVRGTRS